MLEERFKLRHVPIIGYSAEVTPHLERKSIEIGMDEIHSKPMKKEMFEELVMKMSPTKKKISRK